MTFTSIAFIAFFILMVGLFYLSPKRLRWVPLLLGSCYFYAAFVPKYIFILFALILIDYTLAHLMARSRGRAKLFYFVVGLISTVSMLFIFKYFNFFNTNIAALAHLLDWNYSAATLRLLLPLGLSFHTFQCLSYLIEVYRGKYPAEKHLGIFALYVMFFPQLVAGPIERPAHLLEQLKHLDTIRFNPKNIFSGVRLMAWGFFKKMAIADRLAISVDYVYAHIGTVPGIGVIAAMVFFAIQLYADFSGYSDIARGSARALGIDVVRNFEQPFFSRSVAEFWRRWHVSLSNWFRDYVYYPLALGGRRWGAWWSYATILITFSVMGIWHGAGWTYITMGFLFGLYIVIETILPRMRKTLLNTVGTFALVSVTFVFFRAPDMHTAFAFIRQTLRGWDFNLSHIVATFQHPFLVIGISRNDLLIALGLITLLLAVEYSEQKEPVGATLARQPFLVRSFAYSSFVIVFALLGLFASHTFIYFQF